MTPKTSFDEVAMDKVENLTVPWLWLSNRVPHGSSYCKLKLLKTNRNIREGTMSNLAKLEYLKSVRERYHKSNKIRKSLILDEFCANLGLSRKHAIKLLRLDAKLRENRSGPKIKYDPKVLITPLHFIWLNMREVNSKKLKAGLDEWLLYSERCDHPDLFPEEVKNLLNQISASSLERLLKQIRNQGKRGKTSTRPNKRFMSRIPIQAKDWNVTKPGSTQADTVAHCGDTLLGSYANSLTVTDIFTGWTENRAIWTKGASKVIDEMAVIERLMPFKIETFKSDSGTEFMNFALRAYLEERPIPIKMVRSRPYRKDDNCYVEQKNFTHVRELFGYDRITSPDLVIFMNEIYTCYWNQLHNFFIPSTKLLRKTRIGARIKKEFEPHKTPYQRVMESKDVSEEQKEALRQKKIQLNPFELSKGLDLKLREFFERLRRESIKVA